MNEYGFDLDNCKTISDENFSALVNNGCKVEKGDVLFSKDGTMGIVCVPKKNIDVVLLSSIAILKPKNIIDSYFLGYYLKSPNTQRLISSGFVSGSALPRIVLKDLKKLPLIFTPLAEQKAIAKILSDLDVKIELNHQMNNTLEKIAQAIFKHWFIDFEFPNEEGKPYKSNGGKMVESEMGEIPRGWYVGSFGEIIKIKSGKRPKIKSDEINSEFSIPLIGASSIMAYVNVSLYDEPILIIGRVGTHGIVQRVMPPSFPSDNTLVIKTKFFEYVYQALKRIDYYSLNVGTTQPLITQSTIKKHRLIIPTKSILTKFEMAILSLFNKINYNNNEIDKLSQIRDSLLPRLMSGKIRVNYDKKTTQG